MYKFNIDDKALGIKVGDIVKVNNEGYNYPTYKEFFGINKINKRNFIGGIFSNEDKKILGKVRFIGNHPHDDKTIAVVDMPHRTYLINVKGLTVVQSCDNYEIEE